VDIDDFVAVTDEHHPAILEEMIPEIANVDQEGRKSQFLQSA
jgi:hypothetical protein